MTNPNDTVDIQQIAIDGIVHAQGGLTKREYFALEFAKSNVRSDYSDTPIADAIAMADALIDKLNKTKDK